MPRKRGVWSYRKSDVGGEEMRSDEAAGLAENNIKFLV